MTFDKIRAWFVYWIEIFAQVTIGIVTFAVLPSVLLAALISPFCVIPPETPTISKLDSAKSITLSHVTDLGFKDTVIQCYGNDQDQICELVSHRDAQLVVLKYGCKAYKGHQYCDLLYSSH